VWWQPSKQSSVSHIKLHLGARFLLLSAVPRLLSILEQLLEDRNHIRRVILWSESQRRRAVVVDNKLCKVPFDSVDEGAAERRLEENVERMSVGSVDVNLGEELEFCVVFRRGERLDFFVGPGFLAAKLIAWKPEDP